jgi:hypothetical protein
VSEKNQVPQEISPTDIEELLRTSSDFGLEMRVLKEMRQLGFDCSHAGTYRDAVTHKSREYDIRAARLEGTHCLYVSVECKGFSTLAPVLVHRTVRTDYEAYHYVLIKEGNFSAAQTKKLAGFYSSGQPVGKKTNHLTRHPKTGVLSGNDEIVFKSVDQALSSAFDLVQTAAQGREQDVVYAIVPMVVIPDNTLWCVDYNKFGEHALPMARAAVSYYLGHQVQLVSPVQQFSPFFISHVEIVTFTELSARLDTLMKLFNVAETS